MVNTNKNCSSLDNEVMRILLAYTFLNSSFSKVIRKFTEDRHQATPPELGLDINLLDQFSRLFQRQDEHHKERIAPMGAILILSSGIVVAGGCGMYYANYWVWMAFLIITVGLWFILTSREFGRAKKIQRDAMLFTKDGYSAATIADHFNLYGTLIRYQIISEYMRLIIGSGKGSPFVGAGLGVGGWSFVVDLSKPPQDNPTAVPVVFETNELYSDLQELYPKLGIEGAIAQDYYFVNGKRIRGNRMILPFSTAKPRQGVPLRILEEYSKQSNSEVRKYKWFRVNTWKDEIVISFLFRCNIQGKSLYVESNRFILPPLDKKFHEVDKILELLINQSDWELLSRSVFIGPLRAFGAVLEFMPGMFTDIFHDLAEEQVYKRIGNQPDYDYGTDKSFREILSGTIEEYFQVSDIQMNIKILESCLLDAIIDFLHEHNIDTSEIKERQTTILNSGVLVQGGNISAESIAVGEKAQAVTNKIPYAQKGVGTNE